MHWTDLANATKFHAAYKYSCAEQVKEVACNEIVNRMTSIEVYINNVVQLPEDAIKEKDVEIATLTS
jgi:hypothetical protein